MPSATRRPGPDSTLDDVRAKLIEAGTSLLYQRGVDLGLNEISLSDVIAAAGVTRSTAYRSLADDQLAPQAVLHQELLVNLLTRFSRGETITVIEDAVAAEFQQNEQIMATGTVAERTRVLRSLIRVGANSSYLQVIASPERSILTAMYGALRSSSQTPDWRHHALSLGERALNAMFTQLYGGFSELFDYRVKPPLTLDQFTTAGASLVEGIAMRDGFNDHVKMIERATGPEGKTEEWTLFAVAFEAMFVGMFEPNNPDNPFADLSRY